MFGISPYPRKKRSGMSLRAFGRLRLDAAHERCDLRAGSWSVTERLAPGRRAGELVPPRECRADPGRLRADPGGLRSEPEASAGCARPAAIAAGIVCGYRRVVRIAKSRAGLSRIHNEEGPASARRP